MPKDKVCFPLKMNDDNRGSFTELLKSEKVGQISVNISKPGITKGEHWHNTKWEFFIVVFSESELKAIGFLKYGKNVLVSRKASIYNPEQMVLGDNIRIDDFCILSGNIKLGSYIHIPAAYRRTSYFRRLCERGNRKYNFARR